ncbi:MAG: cyclic nucleotide-binding domain-containing protein [candidate division Zixibacteria bacterium]|nr:cyclic nucleotide-binding domain-containing protein [candidate division Zixibacteria bacterium]
METLERYVAEHPFFAGMSEKHIQLIVGCASNVKYDAGQQIDRAGMEANTFFLVRQGRVAVEIVNPTSGPITIQTVGDGDVLGWSWLFPPYIHHFDSKALDLTRAIALDGKCLRQKCDADHELGYELFKRFAQIMEQRIASTRLQLMDLYK